MLLFCLCCPCSLFLSLLSTLFMLFVLLTEHFIWFHFCFCIRYWINFFFYFSLVATLEFSSLVSQMVKNLPAMPETRVQSLGQKDPLKKGLATYYSNLAWRISRTEEPGRLQSMEPQRFGHDWVTNTRICNIHLKLIEIHFQTTLDRHMDNKCVPYNTKIILWVLLPISCIIIFTLFIYKHVCVYIYICIYIYIKIIK